jgi:hypothetical protein
MFTDWGRRTVIIRPGHADRAVSIIPMKRRMAKPFKPHAVGCSPIRQTPVGSGFVERSASGWRATIKRLLLR